MHAVSDKCNKLVDRKLSAAIYFEIVHEDRLSTWYFNKKTYGIYFTR